MKIRLARASGIFPTSSSLVPPGLFLPLVVLSGHVVCSESWNLSLPISRVSWYPVSSGSSGSSMSDWSPSEIPTGLLTVEELSSGSLTWWSCCSEYPELLTSSLSDHGHASASCWSVPGTSLSVGKEIYLQVCLNLKGLWLSCESCIKALEEVNKSQRVLSTLVFVISRYFPVEDISLLM